ncbi:hypothetical protein F5Y13DRAFT_190827 [Hypoxylon sp. FL1857]|nr:hypothetical protein F5Y13DRAFT_190827 [Hypoxylon sp. FL1857]
MEPQAQFHKFPLLPPEVQDMIWNEHIKTLNCGVHHYLETDRPTHECVDVYAGRRMNTHVKASGPLTKKIGTRTVVRCQLDSRTAFKADMENHIFIFSLRGWPRNYDSILRYGMTGNYNPDDYISPDLFLDYREPPNNEVRREDLWLFKVRRLGIRPYLNWHAFKDNFRFFQKDVTAIREMKDLEVIYIIVPMECQNRIWYRQPHERSWRVDDNGFVPLEDFPKLILPHGPFSDYDPCSLENVLEYKDFVTYVEKIVSGRTKPVKVELVIDSCELSRLRRNDC